MTMQIYKNKQNASSILAYEYGRNWIRVQFTSGAIRMYTYKNTGWLNVEAMKKFADKGEGLCSYIYGPFGFYAVLSKLSCRFMWLRQLKFISFIGRQIKFALTPYYFFHKYNSRYASDNTSNQTKDKNTLKNSSESTNRKFNIILETNESALLQSSGTKQSINEELYTPNSNHCVTRLLWALKNIPETFSPSL